MVSGKSIGQRIAVVLGRIALEPHKFHGEWNYTIKPN
jgi:hypothetical protein